MLLKDGFLDKTQKSRIDYIDIFRGLGIILMVMGHIGYGHLFDFFIHAFHMPIFFWISGYLFRHRSKEELPFSAFLIKKVKSLLLPYVVFGVAHYLLYIVKKILKHESVSISPLVHLFSVNTNGLEICGALWFLTSLFFTDTLFFLFDRYIKDWKRKTTVIFVVALVGNYAGVIFPFTLPFALGPSLVGIGLYYIGYLFKLNQDNKVISGLMNLSWLRTIVLGVVTAILIFSNGYINMRAEQYSIVALFWINALLSIIVGINFSKLICRHIQNRVWGKWLIGIGKDSIIYVCLNQVIIIELQKVITKIVPVQRLSSIFVLIIALLMLYVISRIFENTKLKALIGK